MMSDYTKPLSTNETYHVPQRYNWTPKGNGGGYLAPCTNPATYIDLSHFPTFFKTDEETLHTYNAMAIKYKMQFKRHNVSRREDGEVSKFHLVCQKKGNTRGGPRQGL